MLHIYIYIYIYIYDISRLRVKFIARLPQNVKFGRGGPNLEGFDFSWYLGKDQGDLRQYNVRWIIFISSFEITPVYTVRYSNAMRCVAGWNIFPNLFEGLILCLNPRSFLMRGQIMHHFSSRVWTHKKRELNYKCLAFFSVLCVYSPELCKAQELILLFIFKFEKIHPLLFM